MPDKIKAIQKIVDEKQHGKVEGFHLDLFSASAILNVFNALSEKSQAKYISMSVPAMANTAFKLLK